MRLVRISSDAKQTLAAGQTSGAVSADGRQRGRVCSSYRWPFGSPSPDFSRAPDIKPYKLLLLTNTFALNNKKKFLGK